MTTKWLRSLLYGVEWNVFLNIGLVGRKSDLGCEAVTSVNIWWLHHSRDQMWDCHCSNDLDKCHFHTKEQNIKNDCVSFLLRPYFRFKKSYKICQLIFARPRRGLPRILWKCLRNMVDSSIVLTLSVVQLELAVSVAVGAASLLPARGQRPLQPPATTQSTSILASATTTTSLRDYLPHLKYWPHLALPASFFSRFSFALLQNKHFIHIAC